MKKQKITLNGQTRAGEGSRWEMEIDSSRTFKARIFGSAGSVKRITTNFKSKINKETVQEIFSEIKKILDNKQESNLTKKDTVKTQAYTLSFEKENIINDKQDIFNEIDSIVKRAGQKDKKIAEFFSRI